MNRTLYIKYISNFISILFSSILFSQNYVINPSFENATIPTNISQFGYAYGWNSPTFGTPDLFSLLSKRKNSKIPNNYCGFQDTIDGRNYAGIITYLGKGNRLVEFIQGELNKEMLKGVTYKIEFDYSLAESSSVASNTLGAYLSTKEYYPNDNFPKKIDYSVFINDKKKLSIQSDWSRFSENYKAKGSEKFIIIGQIENAKNDVDTGYSYYYIDNVSVTMVDSNISNSSLVIDSIEPIKMNQSIVINNIYFESNSSSLKEESNNVLDSLYQQLLQFNNSEYEIEISGHTDNIGKEEDNLILSELRAQAVASYLINKGINREIIKHIGYGSSSPIARNDSEKEREMNRRVELIIRAR
jgi:OOP family OmpA-OmpF porin